MVLGDPSTKPWWSSWGAAIVKELRKSPEERTWHGVVAGVVPYDFRFPTLEGVKAKLWTPDGPVVSPHIFGVGWTPNLGRIVADVKSLADRL